MHFAKSAVRSLSFAVAFAVVSLLCICSTRAAGVNLSGLLNGQHVVPANASPAIGNASAFMNITTDVFSITNGTYSNLLSGALTVTLNDGAPGTNGPIIATLTLDSPGATSGTFHGSATLTAAQVTDVTSGLAYLNIADSLFPNGEIRGQLSVTPEPSAIILGVLGGLALLMVRRSGSRNAA
jgi:hypothetical protein